MLDQLKVSGKIAYMALFTDDAATVEVSGGSPAYARKAVTWDAAGTGGAGKLQLNNTLPSFDVPACTIRAIGFYDTLTAGTQAVMFTAVPEVFAAQGTYTITGGSITSS